MTRDQFDGKSVTRMIEEAKAAAWTEGYVAGLEYARTVIFSRLPEALRPQQEEAKHAPQ